MYWLVSTLRSTTLAARAWQVVQLLSISGRTAADSWRVGEVRILSIKRDIYNRAVAALLSKRLELPFNTSKDQFAFDPVRYGTCICICLHARHCFMHRGAGEEPCPPGEGKTSTGCDLRWMAFTKHCGSTMGF